MAVIDVVSVQIANDDELVNIAKKCNFNLNNYVVKVLKF
jgi:hypothetical protein